MNNLYHVRKVNLRLNRDVLASKPYLYNVWRRAEWSGNIINKVRHFILLGCHKNKPRLLQEKKDRHLFWFRGRRVQISNYARYYINWIRKESMLHAWKIEMLSLLWITEFSFLLYIQKVKETVQATIGTDYYCESGLGINAIFT